MKNDPFKKYKKPMPPVKEVDGDLPPSVAVWSMVLLFAGLSLIWFLFH